MKGTTALCTSMLHLVPPTVEFYSFPDAQYLHTLPDGADWRFAGACGSIVVCAPGVPPYIVSPTGVVEVIYPLPMSGTVLIEDSVWKWEWRDLNQYAIPR